VTKERASMTEERGGVWLVSPGFRGSPQESK